ncbi:hypothetical protein CHISP_1762 [Chitinispirillum alkaliphilum]|nr:hypothetical protein CHISP_1762 [Chitinispirillum alkaliphilum]
MSEIIYQPGPFQKQFNRPESKKLWNFLSSPEVIKIMSQAIEDNKLPIIPLLPEIEGQYRSLFIDKDFCKEETATFINNMIKQILVQSGFLHTGCGLCSGEQIKNSGVFSRPDEALT